MRRPAAAGSSLKLPGRYIYTQLHTTARTYVMHYDLDAEGPGGPCIGARVPHAPAACCPPACRHGRHVLSVHVVRDAA